MISKENHPIHNATPDWWDSSRPFNDSLISSKHVKKLIDKVEKINSVGKFEGYTLGAKVLLTDACFTLRPLSKMQILLTYIVLQGHGCEKASELLHKVFEKFPTLRKDAARRCVKRTLMGNMYSPKKIYRNTGYLSYIDSMILVAETDLLIASGNPPRSRYVIERAKTI